MSIQTPPSVGRPTLAEAELRVETTAGDEFTATGDDRDGGVLEFDVEQHASDQVDQAEIVLANNDGRYGTDHRISRGDKIEWWARLEAESVLTRRWTGMVEEVTWQRLAPDTREVVLTADDYVFGVLTDREVYRVFIDEEIDTIVEDLISAKTPELSTDLPDIDETATVPSNGQNLLEIVESLAKRANCLMYGDGSTLRWEQIADLERAVTLSEDNLEAAIGGQYSYNENPDDLATFVRVDGGDGAREDDIQETQDDYYTVTDSDRLLVQISPTRSKLDRVELIPRQLPDSSDSISVRIQRDDGTGNPKNPDDSTADIASANLDPDDASWVDDEWSRWTLQEHIAHDEDPWLIVEASGGDGQEVAVDANDKLTYRTFYAYPVLAEQPSPTTEAEYGRIERSIKDESIRSFEQAEDEATATLEKYQYPRETFECEAASPATFDLQFGDAVRIDFPEDGAVGQYVVVDRTDVWGEALDLRTTLTLQSARSVV